MMFEHFKGDELFVKKVLDMASLASQQQRMILTPFYNPHEQDVVKKVIGNHDLKVVSYGGFENAENCRMVICPDFYDITQDDFQLVLVQITYPRQFEKLKHKDVLGALMNLGVKREYIGDIYDGNQLYFCCTSSLFPYLLENVTQIKHTKVKLKECHDVVTIEREYQEKTFFLSSWRLDRVVATLFRLSRQQASTAIRSGFVKVNYKEVEEVDFLCHNNDMISLKRHGRVKIKDEGRTSRSGSAIIQGYFYK